VPLLTRIIDISLRHSFSRLTAVVHVQTFLELFVSYLLRADVVITVIL